MSAEAEHEYDAECYVPSARNALGPRLWTPEDFLTKENEAETIAETIAASAIRPVAEERGHE